MNFGDLTQAILKNDGNGLVYFINTNIDEIKLLFLNTTDEPITQQQVSESFLALNQRDYTDINETHAFQGLVNQFALFFKRTKRDALVASCRHLSVHESFKNRIDAYILTRSYNDVVQHISRIEDYLQKISTAVYSEEQDYSTEIVNDIEEYFAFGKDQLEQFGQANRVSEFVALFEKEELVEAYPILKQFLSKIYSRHFDLPVNELKDKVQEPTDFSEKLFEDKIIQYIKQHPNTIWHDKPLGYTNDIIRYEILETGLANFDEPYKNISPKERVKLYCYFNLRKHYFTSYSIFERLPTLLELSQHKNPIKFIDIGCGPATSGLAFIDFIYTQTGTRVHLDYFGIDISKTMLAEASELLNNEAVNSASAIRLYDNLSNVNIDDLKGGSCLLINTCYFVGSPAFGPLGVRKNF